MKAPKKLSTYQKMKAKIAVLEDQTKRWRDILGKLDLIPEQDKPAAGSFGRMYYDLYNPYKIVSLEPEVKQ